MKTTSTFKKVMIAGLTFALVIGGSTSAFANGNKDKGHDKSSIEKSHQSSSKKSTKYANDKFKFSFDDIKGTDVAWAAKNVASLASKQVFEGYEDGTFRPRNTINRIEALTAAVRLLGLKAQAESAAEMATVLNFKDADKITSEYAWAVGYVAVAAENDLFAETDTSVQPEKAATRLWATTLLVKALKLDAEAKAKINTKLTFKDAHKIPAGSVGYIAVALEKGLITGFEDNTFRPDAAVTRAQLAALLDRTNDVIIGNEGIKGTVTAAVYNNILTITSDSVVEAITIDPSVFIYKANVRVAPTALVVGDKVRIHLYNGIAIFIEVV